MSIEQGAAKYGSRHNAAGTEHTAAPWSVGGLQQTNCPKTGKPEHVEPVGSAGEIECRGCGAKISYNAISK